MIESAGADMSPCGLYRWRLWRVWDDARQQVCFVMLNPSTADGSKDDPTIRRCRGFARSWGYGGFVVVNLFAWRATKPADLAKAMRAGRDVVGPLGDRAIRDAACGGQLAPLVVAAWGRPGWAWVANRAASVLADLRSISDVHAIELALPQHGGYPRHPLMLRADRQPIRL